jgi:hypothetical protein
MAEPARHWICAPIEVHARSVRFDIVRPGKPGIIENLVEVRKVSLRLFNPAAQVATVRVRTLPSGSSVPVASPVRVLPGDITEMEIVAPQALSGPSSGTFAIELSSDVAVIPGGELVVLKPMSEMEQGTLHELGVADSQSLEWFVATVQRRPPDPTPGPGPDQQQPRP